MKKLLAFILILFIASAAAEEVDQDWYYPFGLSESSTYDDTVNKIIDLYECSTERTRRNESQTTVFPIDKTLFDVPIQGIIVMKNAENNKYSQILIRMKDNYNQDGILHFMDALFFLRQNAKTDLLHVEPYKITYDLNGNATVKTFLDDLDSFTNDFLNKEKEMDYTVSWYDTFLRLTKTKDEYTIDIMFFNKEN